MSLPTQDRIAAFRASLDVSGKRLELVAGEQSVATVCALVNQGLDAVRLNKGDVDFGERNKTHVEFLRCDIAEDPKVGQHWKDDDGDYHRIQVLRKTDITWRCDCEVHGPDETE